MSLRNPINNEGGSQISHHSEATHSQTTLTEPAGKPRITVMVPTRNRLEPLRKCVESVLSQELEDFEIIILDDASDGIDTAAAVAEEFKDSRIRPYRNETSLCAADARNFIFDRAEGEIIVSLDDDAYFTRNDGLDQVYASFENHPEVGIVCFNVTKFMDGKQIPQVPFRRQTIARDPDIITRRSLVSAFIGCGAAFRTSLIRQLKGYQGKMGIYGEEMDIAYRAIQAGYQISYEPAITVNHVPQPSVVDPRNNNGASEIYYSMRNRCYLAYRYLPWRYLFTYLGVWVSYHALRGFREGRIIDFVRGIADAPRFLRGVKREVLDKRAIQYMTHNEGRLWS